MIHITKEELLKLARISNVRLYDDEIPGLTKQIQDVLSYAQRVQEIVTTAQQGLLEQKNENVVRPDVVVSTDPEPLLALAPQQEEHFLVVQKIIDSK